MLRVFSQEHLENIFIFFAGVKAQIGRNTSHFLQTSGEESKSIWGSKQGNCCPYFQKISGNLFIHPRRGSRLVETLSVFLDNF